MTKADAMEIIRQAIMDDDCPNLAYSRGQCIDDGRCDCGLADALAALALPPDPDQITTDNSATLVNALERELPTASAEPPARGPAGTAES